MFLKVYLKHGEKQVMWLNELKSAVVLKDLKKVSDMLDALPDSLSEKDISQASYLLEEASSIAKDLKDDTALKMKQVKKSIDFLQATQSTKHARLDITS